MADQKISAMPAATQVNDSDIVPIVQGGANKSATRAKMLTAAPGVQISLVGSDSSAVQVSPDGTISVLNSAGGLVQVAPDGSIVISSATGVINVGSLSTVNPHVVGQLFRTGTALQVSTG
jgi:hypothetical protein